MNSKRTHFQENMDKRILWSTYK